MEFYQINDNTHNDTPDSFRSFSKGDSPTKFQSDPNTNVNRDFQVSRSDMSSPSHVHFQVPSPENDSFKVYVRVRPLDNKEQSASNPKTRLNIIKVEDQMLFVLNPYIGPEWSYKPERSYVFNKVFDQDVRTVDLYDDGVSSAVKNVLNGYNSTVLAYGMTGAGKTFTMFGDIYNVKGGPIAHPGVISLIVSDLFNTFERETAFEFKIKISYLEIYNEHVRDLLTSSSEDLMIVEDSERGIVIPSLSEFYITSHEDIFKLILQGNARRIMASTHANQFSSRSHAIIQLFVEKRSKTKDIVDTFLQSKLCLVDLAGSERAAVSENRGLRHREGANINRSLLALGNCINILSDPNKKGAYVPYRDSKLTRLLKESLGGNTQTVFLACISPSYMAYEETVNTLKYASRARNIQKKVVQNVKEVELHVSEYKGIIESLRAEVNLLKQKLNQKDNEGIESIQPKLAAEYAAQVNTALDELGKKLMSIFEENWEFTQSLNELKELKTQNEEVLKLKVYELGRTVGNVQRYNIIADEIAALKEVMANNENIQKEMELNLERSNQERKLVQSQILAIISQNAQSSNATKREICLEELARHSPLVNMESPTFRKMVHAPDGTLGEERGTKMEELLDEVEQMKKQLAEKDKLLVKNQEIIQSFLQTNPRQEPTKLTSSMRLIPQCSPIRDQPQIDNGRESAKWADLSHQDEELRAAAMINRIPTTAQMTSLSTINTHPAIIPHKITDQLPASLFSQTSSTVSLSKALESRRAPINEQQEFQAEAITPTQRGFHVRAKEPFYQGVLTGNKLVENPGDVQISQNSGVSSLDDLNGYAAQLNRASLDNIREEAPEIENFQYRTCPPTTSNPNEMPSPNHQVNRYRLPDQTLAKDNTVHKQHAKSLCNNSPYLDDTSRYKLPKSPTSQVHQQQTLIHSTIGNDFSPNLSSIAVQPQEHSGDGSFKDLISENLNALGKISKGSTRLSSSQYGKENLQKRDVSPKTAIPVTTVHTNKHAPHKSPARVKTVNTSKSKLYGTSSPDTVSKSKIQKSLKDISSPTGIYNKTKSLIPTSSPDRQTVFRSQDKLMTSSLHINPKQVAQEEKFSYGIQSDIKAAKKSFGEPAKEKYEIKASSSKSKNEGNRNQSISPFLQANKSKAQNTDYRDNKSAYTILEPRNELKSLDTRRDLVKVFRTKLHQLSAAIDNNRVGEIYIRDIKALIEEYKLNAQTYPLSTGDLNALRKLESFILREAPENEGGFTDMIKTKDTAEALSESTYTDNGERPFGNVQISPVSERRNEVEKRSVPVVEENKARDPPVVKSTSQENLNPKIANKSEIIPLYIAFGLIVFALLFNLIQRLGAK